MEHRVMGENAKTAISVEDGSHSHDSVSFTLVLACMDSDLIFRLACDDALKFALEVRNAVEETRRG